MSTTPDSQMLFNHLDHWDSAIRVLRSETYILNSGRPQAKQSAQFGGKRAWTPAKKKAYVKLLTEEFKRNYPAQANPIVGMVRLSILYCFPWTKAQKAEATLNWALTGVGVDLDNLSKPLSDALQGIVLANDAQVVETRARKIRFSHPLIAVKIEEVMANRTNPALAKQS